MTISAIDPAQTTQPLLNSTPASHPFDLGQQFLSFLKMLIYGLVLLKLFQLTFLRYRRKLALSDRIERKYRYCHNELIDNYSEDETKLMLTTIHNTIQNTQVKSPDKQQKVKKIAKRVSFNVDKNSYHTHQDIQDIMDQQPRKVESPTRQTSLIETSPIEEESKSSNRARAGLQVIYERSEVLQKGQGQAVIQDEAVEEVQESKLTQETEASSVMESNLTRVEVNDSESRQLSSLHRPHL